MITIEPYLTEEDKKLFQQELDQGSIHKEKDKYQVWINSVRSNLSVKSYLTSLKEEFIRRSQEKHLTDILGHPLVVRHGSFIQFHEFNHNTNGIFFCDLYHATEYAHTRLAQETGGYNINDHKISLYECFIKADKRYICNNEKYRDIDVANIWSQGYDGIIAYNTRDSAGTYDQYIVKEPSQIYKLQIL